MPVHDWTRVEAGIFHAFHHGWIEELKRSLNTGFLPAEYYAMVEQHGVRSGPDLLTLQTDFDDDGEEAPAGPTSVGGVALQLSPPAVRLTAETDMEFYRRKQNAVVVRHVTGDRIVAVVEVVSPGNKAGRRAFQAFLEKACELLDRQIHLLVLDLQPPTPRDPQGIHGAIWEEITGQQYVAPGDKPLTLAAYESALGVKAYVEPVAVGDVLADMPLFLEPGAHVLVPLETTYMRAMSAMPRRWRTVLDNQ